MLMFMFISNILLFQDQAAASCGGLSTLIARNRAEIEEANRTIAQLDAQVAAIRTTQDAQYHPLRASFQKFNDFIDLSEKKREESVLVLKQVQVLLEKLAGVGSSVSELDRMIQMSLAARPEYPMSSHLEAALNLVNLLPDDRTRLVGLLEILKTQEKADQGFLLGLQQALAQANGAEQKFLEPLIKSLNGSLYRSQMAGENSRQTRDENAKKLAQLDRNLEDANREIGRLWQVRANTIAFRDTVIGHLRAREQQDRACSRSASVIDNPRDRFN